jgi:hypothetical protein
MIDKNPNKIKLFVKIPSLFAAICFNPFSVRFGVRWCPPSEHLGGAKLKIPFNWCYTKRMANDQKRSLKELDESIEESKQLLQRLSLTIADLEDRIEEHRKALDAAKKRKK